MSRYCACLCGGLFVTALAVAPPSAASAPIYKCFDNHLALVYTDLPCKDGEVVDIRAGDADPAAVAHLELERDQIDQSAALRMQDERYAAERQTASVPLAQEDLGAQQSSAESDSYGYLAYPTYLRRPPHPHHRRALRPLQARGGAPKPPYSIARH